MVWCVTSKSGKRALLILALLCGFGVVGAQGTAASAAPVVRCSHSAASRPVILIHDLAKSGSSWDAMARAMRAHGRCVQVLDYGKNQGLMALVPGGMTGIDASATELAAFVDRVETTNPGRGIDLVAHGTGSLVALTYLQKHRDDDTVRSLTSLGPLWKGTNVGGLGTLEQLSRDLGTYSTVLAIEAPLEDPVCRACREMIMGSDLVRRLQSEGLVLPNVVQTNILTAADGFVVPVSSGFAEGMTNIRLQDLDPSLGVSHVGLPAESAVIRLVEQILGR